MGKEAKLVKAKKVLTSGNSPCIYLIEGAYDY